jgi:hypothetical protein
MLRARGEQGAKRAFIIEAVPHAILIEMLTDEASAPW